MFCMSSLKSKSGLFSLLLGIRTVNCQFSLKHFHGQIGQIHFLIFNLYQSVDVINWHFVVNGLLNGRLKTQIQIFWEPETQSPNRLVRLSPLLHL